MRKIWVFVVLLVGCGVNAQTSPITSPLVSPIRIYFPTLGKDATQSKWKGVGSTYPVSCDELRDFGITWYYGWHTAPASGELCSDVEFVPMIFSTGHRDEELVHNSNIVMLTNEPHLETQGNETLEQTMDLAIWTADTYPELKLGSPTFELPEQTMWYDELERRGYGDRVGAICVHLYYDGSGSVAGAVNSFCTILLAYRALADRANAELWLTEFAYITDDVEKRVEFMQLVLPMLKIVDRIAPFQWSMSCEEPWWWWQKDTCTDLYRDGQPTELGQVYKDY